MFKAEKLLCYFLFKYSFERVQIKLNNKIVDATIRAVANRL